MPSVTKVVIGLLICALPIGPGHAQSANFNLTPIEFQNRFNAQLQADGGDSIKNCSSKEDGRTVCTFKDAGFQKSARELKKLGLMQGQFGLKSLLVLETDAGKVFRLGVSGSRDTPMGLFHHIGQVGSLIKTFEEGIPQERVTKVLEDLGLMRGDDDPTIGQPLKVELSKIGVSCLNQLSSKSTAVVCMVVPASR